jgi:tryptophan synthase alpha chain
MVWTWLKLDCRSVIHWLMDPTFKLVTRHLTVLFDLNIENSIYSVIMGYLMLQYGEISANVRCRYRWINHSWSSVDVYDEYKAILKNTAWKNILDYTTNVCRTIYWQRFRWFIYMVSSASVTGSQNWFWKRTRRLFQTHCRHESKNPQVIGLGINNKETLTKRHNLPKTIIGSAFLST